MNGVEHHEIALHEHDNAESMGHIGAEPLAMTMSAWSSAGVVDTFATMATLFAVGLQLFHFVGLSCGSTSAKTRSIQPVWRWPCAVMRLSP